MAESLEQIAYRIRDSIKGYLPNQDEIMDIEIIYRKMAAVRSLLLKEQYNTQKYLDESIFGQKCCLEVQCSPIACDGIESGDVEYWVDAPNIEALLDDQAIRYFGGPDMKSPYTHRSLNGANFQQYNTYTSHTPSYTITGTKFTLYNLPTKGLKYVCLVAVFEDVMSVCKPEDQFPLPSSLIHKMELLIKKDLMSTLALKPDLKNDAQDTAPNK
jgi:hypothetical protein